MVPRAVLMKYGLVSLNTAKQVKTVHPKVTMNSARPLTKSFPNQYIPTVKWPIRPQRIQHLPTAHDRDMSCRTDYKRLMEDMMRFGGNPQRGKIHKQSPRKNNNISLIDLKNIVPKEGLTCLFGKVTSDESKLWHRRLGHINFKTMNKLVKGNLRKGFYLQNIYEIYQPVFLVKMENNKKPLALWRTFGCPVTILNTVDHLSKFDGKADDGFFVGYSINSKAFRVFNSRTRIVEENLHVQFSKNTPNIARSGPNWLFDIDALTKSMNYKPVIAGNQSNEKDDNVNSTNNVNAASTNKVNADGGNTSIKLLDDASLLALEDIVYSDDDEDVGTEADMNNLEAFMPVSPIPTTRVHKDHPVEQIIKYLNSAPQTRRMTKNLEEHVEPKKVIQALEDPSKIEAMYNELLQFKLQKVWTLVDLPNGKSRNATKMGLRTKKVEEEGRLKIKARFSYSREHIEKNGLTLIRFEDPDFPKQSIQSEKKKHMDYNKLPKLATASKVEDDGYYQSRQVCDEIMKKLVLADVQDCKNTYGNSESFMHRG
ncbi:putative ribonuclease H-like domain-containing protein [Tanacetum coccineum]